jgi:hypothetical protein
MYSDKIKYLPLYIFLSSILLSLSLLSSSPIDKNEYLGQYPGARSIGMGSSGIALQNEPFSSFYNPATLSYIDGSYFLVDIADSRVKNWDEKSILPEFSGVSLGFLSIVNPSGGLTWNPLSKYNHQVDTIFFSHSQQETISIKSSCEYKIDEYYLTLTTLSTHSYQDLNNKPIIGINLKYYRAFIAESETKSMGNYMDAWSNIDSGNGFGIDLGFSYKKEPFLFGVSATNVVSRIYWTDYDNEKAPPILGTGISANFNEKLTLCGDFLYAHDDGKTSFHSGVEYSTQQIKKETQDVVQKLRGGILQGNFLLFRLGINIEDLEKKEDITYSVGIGYRYSRICFNFALWANPELIKNKQFLSQLSFLALF